MAAFVLAPSFWRGGTASRIPPQLSCINVCYPRSERPQHASVTCIADSFDEAVANNHVHDFGRVVPLDDRGCSFPSTDLHISDEFEHILDRLKTNILVWIDSTTVAAIFIRGSLVTGNFQRSGCDSDVDLIIFTDKVLPNSRKQTLRRDIRSLVLQHISASSVDVSFQSVSSVQGSRSLASMLRHYSVPLHGSLHDVHVPTGSGSPFMDLAKDIREQERRFKFLFSQAVEASDMDLQQLAVQWICKRCLRAVSDLCAQNERIHCRDLVPAFKVAAKQFPRFTPLFLNILQISCASSSSDYAGLGSQHALVEFAVSIIPDAVEVVEYLFLQSSNDFDIDVYKERPISRNSNTMRKSMLTLTNQFFTFISNRIYLSKKRSQHYSFTRCELPTLAFSPKVFGTKFGIHKSDHVGCQTPAKLLGHYSHPTLVQNAARICDFNLGSASSLLKDMMRRNTVVDCRVSPSNVVTFCRSEHRFLLDKSFTAPSVLKSMNIREAIDRMCTNCRLPPLIFGTECVHEHIYIQTNVSGTGIRPFFIEDDSCTAFDIAQSERLWISAHGTVSSLHYDASHSALFQHTGRKRMILFPADALQSLGVYPFGHPLHRRARVNLSRSSSLFQEFWDKWAHTAEIVTLNPGDLLIFPPLWAHYTESFTLDDCDLSVSHTFRFW